MLHESLVGELIDHLGDGRARIVRSIVFDKSPETNWMVPWHQDPTIAVSHRIEAAGFGPWSVKDGEPHCRPPAPILESIFIIRVHLDECAAASGPLRVVPGSHAHGVLDPDDVDATAARGPVVDCVTPLGGAVLMRPLTVHCSSKASATSGRRRVLHMECSAATLPHGLEWAEAGRSA